MSTCPFARLFGPFASPNAKATCPFKHSESDANSSSIPPNNLSIASSDGIIDHNSGVQAGTGSNSPSVDSNPNTSDLFISKACGSSETFTESSESCTENSPSNPAEDATLFDNQQICSDSITENEGEKGKPKCPYGYDSMSFEVGPLSCVICKALLFDSCRSIPCKHIFCRGCIARFKDCPICGADIESLEPDEEMQSLVEKFIEGHARIQRSLPDTKDVSPKLEKLNLKNYTDSSLERGSFLLQQAIRAFHAGNILSAQNRLKICLDDTKDELARQGSTSAISCQLGAILGSLGDCCRLVGDSEEAFKHYEESVNYLIKVKPRDIQVVHALSVSLNKQGDLKYYDGELEDAIKFYSKALEIREEASIEVENDTSLLLDICVSLSKVADVDRAMGNDAGGFEGFKKALNMAEKVKIPADEIALNLRRKNMVEFIKSQMEN